MPKELGYTWEGGKLRQQVTLFQGSGAIQIVPLDVCRNLEVCKASLSGMTPWLTQLADLPLLSSSRKGLPWQTPYSERPLSAHKS